MKVDISSLIADQLIAKPQAFTLFGATGDLAWRKIFPAIFQLYLKKKLPHRFYIVAVGRKDFSDESFRSYVSTSLKEILSTKEELASFLKMIFYLQLDLSSSFDPLKKLHLQLTAQFGTLNNHFFYLSVAPSFFPIIPLKLKEASLIYPTETSSFSHVLIEKPFGIDKASSIFLDKQIKAILKEEQIYRIDHYLGKETVQNLFALRFANHFIDHLFSSQFVESVQLIASEDLVVGDRVLFYEEVGCMRDIVQNHLLQVIAFVAMEPPIKNNSSYIHQEKAKLLQSIRALDPIVRAQYKDGFIKTKRVAGYRNDPRVSQSNIETFVAGRFFIDNARWSSVPFYFFAGKALPYKKTEINIVFKQNSFSLFPHFKGKNVLSIKIQPKEKIELKLTAKIPSRSSLKSVKLDYAYEDYFGGEAIAEAYETLIYNALCQDQSLFTHIDEVFACWDLCDPVIADWKKRALLPSEFYEAGSWPQIMDTIFLPTQYLVI